MDATAGKRDVTAPLRSRRYRRKQKEINASVTVSTVEMCGLAARLESGRATAEDIGMAGRLVLALVKLLPADSAIELRDS